MAVGASTNECASTSMHSWSDIFCATVLFGLSWLPSMCVACTTPFWNSLLSLASRGGPAPPPTASPTIPTPTATPLLPAFELVDSFRLRLLLPPRAPAVTPPVSDPGELGGDSLTTIGCGAVMIVEVAPIWAGFAAAERMVVVGVWASYENLRPPPPLNDELEPKLLSGVLEVDGEGISTDGCEDLSFLLPVCVTTTALLLLLLLLLLLVLLWLLLLGLVPTPP